MDTSWNKVARQYDKHLHSVSRTGKQNYHQSLIIPGVLSLLNKNVKKGGVVIDLACGQGLVTREIGRAGYVVKGIDLASDLIQIAKNNNRSSGIDFFVDDASGLKTTTIKEVGQADAVTIVLAIQNIQNLDGAINSIGRLLKTGGKCIIVMNHPYFRIPKATSWQFDGNETQYRRVDAYMTETKIPIEMTPGEKANSGKSKNTWSFHRPLERYIGALFAQNFSLIGMEEWISNKVSEPGKRAKAENIARKEIPMFMALVAQYNS